MANDGGPAYPFTYRREGSDGTYDTYEGTGSMSVRDAFAKEIAAHLYPTVTNTDNATLAIEVYTFAQEMTDEKLRRDKADRDEGKANE